FFGYLGARLLQHGDYLGLLTGLRGLERFRELRSGYSAAVENELHERCVAGLDRAAQRILLAWRAPGDQELGDLGVLRPLLLRRADGEHERREAVEGVFDCEIRSLVEQHSDDLEMAVIARIEQRCRVVAELRINVDTVVEQFGDGRSVSFACGVLQLL